MKLRLISDDQDTLAGFRLAGVEGVLAGPDEVADKLKAFAEDKEVGVVIITEKLANGTTGDAKALIDDIRQNRPLPLIVEIPGPEGSVRPPDFIEGYIRQAMGIKLK